MWDPEKSPNDLCKHCHQRFIWNLAFPLMGEGHFYRFPFHSRSIGREVTLLNTGIAYSHDKCVDWTLEIVTNFKQLSTWMNSKSVKPWLGKFVMISKWSVDRLTTAQNQKRVLGDSCLPMEVAGRLVYSNVTCRTECQLTGSHLQ